MAEPIDVEALQLELKEVKQAFRSFLDAELTAAEKTRLTLLKRLAGLEDKIARDQDWLGRL